jgi:hypothetical protein
MVCTAKECFVKSQILLIPPSGTVFWSKPVTDTSITLVYKVDDRPPQPRELADKQRL